MNYGEALTLKRKGKQIKRACHTWNDCWYDRGMKYYRHGWRGPISQADADATDWEVITAETKTA